jgi:hypothetical protein
MRKESTELSVPVNLKKKSISHVLRSSVPYNLRYHYRNIVSNSLVFMKHPDTRTRTRNCNTYAIHSYYSTLPRPIGRQPHCINRAVG